MDVSSRSLDPEDLEFRTMGTQSDLDLLKCSFCGKRNEQVKKMIAGPSVIICNECIDLCNEIIENDILDEQLSETSHLKLEVRPTPQEIHRLLEMGQFTEQEQKVLRRMARGGRYYEVVAREFDLGRDVVRQAARRIFLECSFCEKSHNHVDRLVGGPGVYICNECIELCIEIIEEELSEPSGLHVEEPPTPKQQIDLRTFTEQELQVLELLAQGATGKEIAQEVGPDILGQTLAKVHGELRREEPPEDSHLE
jgi:ATP-dependent protease Clp ATPase subunit